MRCENKPLSCLSGVFQKRRGVRKRSARCVCFVSQTNDFRRTEIDVAWRAKRRSRSMRNLSLGAEWWMARSARAALMALHRPGVAYRWREKTAAAQALGGALCRPGSRPLANDIMTYISEKNQETLSARPKCPDRPCGLQDPKQQQNDSNDHQK